METFYITRVPSVTQLKGRITSATCSIRADFFKTSAEPLRKGQTKLLEKRGSYETSVHIIQNFETTRILFQKVTLIAVQ